MSWDFLVIFISALQFLILLLFVFLFVKVIKILGRLMEQQEEKVERPKDSPPVH